MKECRFLSLWLGRWARRPRAVIGPGVHCSLGRRNTAPLGARTDTSDWAGVGTTGRGNFARTGQARPKHKHARSFSLLGKLASRRLHHILFLHLSLPACLLLPATAIHPCWPCRSLDFRSSINYFVFANCTTFSSRTVHSGSLGRAALQSLLF
jgi:hypothetical protein